jgi:hypothetical protein
MSEQSARRVSSSTINHLRSCSPSRVSAWKGVNNSLAISPVNYEIARGISRLISEFTLSMQGNAMSTVNDVFEDEKSEDEHHT